MKQEKRSYRKPPFPRKILVTAGPTRENIDPVRYITNRSTGNMGYRIAEECLKKGFSVCLVTGPVELAPPEGAEAVKVESAAEMRREVKKRIASCDGIIMSAAVCDFRPEREKKGKIKKKGPIDIKFVKNPDILKEIGTRKGLVKVGFALETGNGIRNGEKKLREKGLDLIILNELKRGARPFGDGKCDYVLMGEDGGMRKVMGAGKKKIAAVIAREPAKLIGRKKA